MSDRALLTLFFVIWGISLLVVTLDRPDLEEIIGEPFVIIEAPRTAEEVARW